MGGHEPGVNRYGMEVQGNRLDDWNEGQLLLSARACGGRGWVRRWCDKIDAASRPTDPPLPGPLPPQARAER